MTSKTTQRWVCEPDGYLEPQVDSSGVGAFPPITVIDVFRQTVRNHGTRPALRYKRQLKGEKLPKEYSEITYNEYWTLCMKFAKSLIHLDVKMHKIINILGFNSHEWFISHLGAILAGTISAGIYSTNLAEACMYISEHSKAEVVVVDGNAQLKKYTIGHDLPHLKCLVVWGEDLDSSLVEKCSVPVYSWNDFLELGVDVPDSVPEERMAQIGPGHCASLIYTSGTTGNPKAVMISHDNLTWTGANIIDHYMDLNHEERCVSYLPLSHVAAQLIDIHCVLKLGACNTFAQPDAMKGTLTNTLKDVRPTFFFGVPRVWEKIQEKLVQIGRDTPAPLRMLSNYAKSVGLEKSRRAQYDVIKEARLNGTSNSPPLSFPCMNALVLNKIKEALGLDQTKGCFTAAAPISPETVWYFAQLDIPVYEVFGQSECTGPHTVSAAKCWKVGSCGRPIRGTRSRISAVNGELSYAGRHIFMGYLFMPKETAETIDEEGFLHSGDVGEFDEDEDEEIPSPSGFLRITGRIKDLIITAGGENIPPFLIENEMKAAMVGLSNCMVIGDKRKFLTMLVSLKTGVDHETGAPNDILAADALFVANEIGSSAKTYTEAKACPLFTKYVNDGMKVANSKTTSNAQIVQKWAWTPVDFSEKAGDLTPTLKLKRNVVCKKYADIIDAMYN